MTPLINLNKVTVLKICGISIIVFSCIFAMASQPIVLVDDAWITFRYAHNLAYHGQLTFNLNERVEGITNALWAIILAFQIRLIPISIVIIAIFNSLLFTAFSLYRIWKIGVFLKINPVLAALPPSILILSRDFYGTVTNGLEAALFTFLLVESIYWFLQGKRQISSLAFGLLFLTRPDTLVLGFIFIGVLLQPSIRLVDGLRLTLNIFNFQTKENRFEIAQCVAIFLGIVVAATGSRLWYYHDFIPNSVRAKFVVYDLSLYKAGLEYVMNFIKDNPHFIFILIGVVGFLFVKVGISFFRNRSCQLSLSNLLYQLIAFCFISILWSFAVVMRGGGDWMSNYRLLAQYSILYIVLLVVLLKEISPYNKLSSSVLLVLLIVSFAQTSMLFTARMKSDTPLASIYYVPSFPFLDETARRLSRSPLVPSDVISAEGIGYISYTLIDTYMHDPLGLTEKYIARYGKSSSPFGKKDIKYTVLKVRPSVMVWHYAGHLQNLDLTILDDEYVTYCLAYCNDWHDADIVMIRKDRAKDLSPYFDGWKKISIKFLFEGDQ